VPTFVDRDSSSNLCETGAGSADVTSSYDGSF